MRAETALPVPTDPQPLDVLRLRYPAALEYVYDTVAIRDRGAVRPAEVAANVFDFEDGLRLIVSRERLPDGTVHLHVSASFPEDSRLAADFRVLYSLGWTAEKVYTAWLKSIPRRFKMLSGDSRDLRYIGVSERLVPHFAIDEAETPF